MQRNENDESFELRRDLAADVGRIDGDYLRLLARVAAIEAAIEILQVRVMPLKDNEISRR